MKTIICYFSGTGNTKKVVLKYVEEFLANGWEAEATPIENADNIDFSKYDSVGIAYPIHAFNAPSNMVDFCKAMPKMKDKKQLYIILKKRHDSLNFWKLSCLKGRFLQINQTFLIYTF